MTEQALQAALERLRDSTRRAIQAELRRLARKASRSPSRILTSDRTTKEQNRT